jgi:ABC-2 type transport system ATP-binding protein
MRMLTGFLPPSSGSAKIAGFDVARQPLEVKRRIGYLPETPPLYPEMRVREYLHFAAALRLVPAPQRAAAVEAAIERCGLKEMARRRVEHLSKGYRQRVGLAQAIVHGPEMIILDEPTSGLDPHQVIEARGIVRDLSHRITVLVSSHILSEVEATCSRVIIINRGQLVASATPQELRDKLGVNVQTVLVSFAGPVEDILARFQRLPSASRVETVSRTEREGREEMTCRVESPRGSDGRNDLARAVLDAGGSLLSLREEAFSLEQSFIRLTQEAPA